MQIDADMRRKKQSKKKKRKKKKGDHSEEEEDVPQQHQVSSVVEMPEVSWKISVLSVEFTVQFFFKSLKFSLTLKSLLDLLVLNYIF